MHLTMATKAITTVTILLSALQAIGSARDLGWTSISDESRLTKTTFQTDSQLVGPSNTVGFERDIRLDTNIIVECPENCKCESTATYCVGNIPSQIPTQIREVTATDLQCKYLENQRPFTHTSWRQVRILRMFGVMEDDFCNGTFITNGFLGGLNELHLLKIDFSSIDNISVNALSPLTELETLDVSGCVRFRLYVLSNALSIVSVAPKISTIIADRIGNLRSAITENEWKDFATVLATRNVSTVNLSSTEIKHIRFTDCTAMCHSLKLLNLSHVRLLSIDDASSWNNSCDSLDILDISGITLPMKAIPVIPVTLANTDVTWSVNPKGLSTLYGNDIFKREVRMYNITINIEFEIDHVTIQNFYFAGNMLRVADMKFVYKYAQNNTEDFTFPFKTLALSRNGMEYVSPGMFNNMKLLHKLDLSHNNLNWMERKMNFGKIFNNLANLHTVDLSYNNLSILPPDIFRGVMWLQNLDVSNNRLKSLSFNMTHLVNLEYLDISQNDIASLDQSEIDAIQDIVNYQQGRRRFNETVKIIEINMRHNPFICSCKTLHFIRWFVQAPVFNDTPSCTCKLDNQQIPLDASAIRQVVYICDRPKILRRNWVIGSMMTFVVVSLLTLAARCVRRKWRARKRQGVIEDVIRRFRDGNLAEKFILFLSHSSGDDALVDNHVYPELRNRLQRTTNIQRDLICTGNRKFRPGRTLFDEMDHCLDISSVFVPVVTLNYVRSYWCTEELAQARMKKKTMIIFFAEDVPPDEMPKILRDFFMRNVRVKIRLNNGQLNIQPSWQDVCDAILHSVAETENNKWNIWNIIDCCRKLCCRISCRNCCDGDRELVARDGQRLV